MLSRSILVVSVTFLGVGCAPRVISNSSPKPDPALLSQLEEEKAKVVQLTKELDALRPPAEGNALPPSELFALPEKYVGKSFSTEGEITGAARFQNGSAVFGIYLSPDNRSNYLECWLSDSADDVSRRILVSKSRGVISVEGQLEKRPASAGSQSWGNGYFFKVNRVLK